MSTQFNYESLNVEKAKQKGLTERCDIERTGFAALSLEARGRGPWAKDCLGQGSGSQLIVNKKQGP